MTITTADPQPHPQAATKVTAEHLRRGAYLYVRQSTLRQVLTNTESTMRQYDLRGRAIALGWTAEQIVVIDSDQGRSGATAADRDGFQRLVAEVGMGRAGIVLGLEVSRLARNNADWQRLLELCALAGTLICDEDGLYDPCTFNDRLLLGLKGTMSEAELHLLKARLRGGVLSKARRGELIQPLPVGLVDDPAGRVLLDPDVGVQQAVRHLFATFARTGSAFAVVKAFNDQGLSFPRRLRAGPNKGELVWGALQHSRVLQVLHNPRYAGAFFYGRHTHRRGPGGKTLTRVLPREQWTVLITDAHPGYVTFAEFEANQTRLAAQAAARGSDRRASPPREGPALLQGLVVCGVCGSRMTVRYHTRGGRQVPEYVCQADGIRHGRPICQRIPGAGVDQQVGALLVDTLTPGGAARRPGGLRRTRRPRRGSRPAPGSRGGACPLPRRPGPPPLPGRGSRQPAGRRRAGGRLERRPARTGRRDRRLRARPPG
jgi:DNA invertase Pin-like site-specific DNA recombinase